MKPLIALATCLILSKVAIAAGPNLRQILSIKPGDQLSKAQKNISGLKPSSSLKGAEYEIESENDIIQSVKIDFIHPVSSAEYLKQDTKGYCLVQPMPGDVPLNRVFFFDLEKKSRYELTPTGKIKSILIQDIPGAKENKQCQFSEVLKIESNSNIKKVK